MKNKLKNFIFKLFQKIRIFINYGILNDIYIGKNVKLLSKKNIKLENEVVIFDNCILNTYPNPYGNPFRIKYSLGKIIIRNKSIIKNNVQFYTYNSTISFGSNVTVNTNCVFYGGGNITIGNDVMIATGTIFVASNHNYSNPLININEQGLTHKGIILEDNIWIGANCIILDGTIIKRGVIVAANSVVKGILEENSIYGGSPVRRIKEKN